MNNLNPIEAQLLRIPTYTVGERLRKAREDAGLTQGQLAAATSISRRQIIYYENNEREPKTGHYLLWQWFTRVPAEWLENGIVTGSGDPDGGGTEIAGSQENNGLITRLGGNVTRIEFVPTRAAA